MSHRYLLQKGSKNCFLQLSYIHPPLIILNINISGQLLKSKIKAGKNPILVGDTKVNEINKGEKIHKHKIPGS